MRTGAEIWAKYVNQHGGLGGHKVNLITADDGGDPSTGLSEAQTMVQQDHVIAFVDSNNVLSEPTIQPYLEQAKVPMVGGDDIASPWFTSPDFFPSGASLQVQLDGIIKATVQTGNTKFGTIVCVEFALICSNAGKIVDQDAAGLGGKAVYDANVSLAQPDFTSQCLAAKSAGVTALFLGLDPASITRVASDCSNQGYHPKYLSISLDDTNSVITSSTVGMISGGSAFPFSVVSAATAQFDQAAQQATGSGPIGEYEALAWVGGLILQTASANLPAANPTAADVLAGLYQIKNNDFGGLASPITYVQGQPTVSPKCAFLIEIGNGAFVAPNGLTPTCQG
jgi:branched-chain amino acid transport system substrate-binding protein